MRALAVIGALAVACGGGSPAGPPDETPPVLPSAAALRAQLTGLGFDDFVDTSFRALLRRSPETVVQYGLEREIDVGQTFLDDASDEFLHVTQDIESVVLELLETYPRESLAGEQIITYDAYHWYLDDAVRGHAFADLGYPINPTLTSVHLNTELFFQSVQQVRDAAEAESFVGRLWRVADQYGQVEARLLRLRQAGIVLPRTLLEVTRNELAPTIQASARANLFYDALAGALDGLAGVDRDSLLDRAADAFSSSVQPAYVSLDALLADEEAVAPQELGIWRQPGGDDFYAYALRHHITAELSPDDVYQLGLDQLDAIHAEMRTRFAGLGYPSDDTIAQSIARATQSAGFLAGADVPGAYAAIISDAETRLPAAFDLLPSADVIVVPVASGGFYVPATFDGSRPGEFFATVGNQEAKLGMRTLAYHETVPGHHLQIDVALHLGLPLFQRVIGFTGYVEGWGLYAEWLAGDLGWYAGDVLGDIGRLQGEAFRAARLVVDTGLHARRWTFDQAVQFFEDATGYGPDFAAGQIIRYASWPGQATAYETGSLRLRALRARVENALGNAFDLRAFHHVVLAHGSLPLDVAESVAAADLGL